MDTRISPQEIEGLKRISFISSDDTRIAGFVVPAKLDGGKKAKGIVQICHGMAEYFCRYDEMIKELNEAGYHVCGMDMPGHGETYEANKERGAKLGFLGESRDTWQVLLEDIATMGKLGRKHLLKNCAEEDRDIPMYLYGHSMGSFIARCIYSDIRYSVNYDGFIFSATAGKSVIIDFGIFLANTASLFGNKRTPGKLVGKIAFGAYHRRIDNPKTEFDWTTSDELKTKEYVADPWGAFFFTNAGFRDMFKLMRRMQSKACFDDICSKRVLITYGLEDPVGDYGKGPHDLAKKLRERAVDVTEIEYPEARHELQHEKCRKKYFADEIGWLNKK